MHVSSEKDPVEIKDRDIVLSFGGIFLYRKLIHAKGTRFFEDCAVLQGVRSV